jgi:hypothetical protein
MFRVEHVRAVDHHDVDNRSRKLVHAASLSVSLYGDGLRGDEIAELDRASAPAEVAGDANIFGGNPRMRTFRSIAACALIAVRAPNHRSA